MRYIPVVEAVLLDENPKLHDEPGIKESIRKYGFQDPGKWDATLESFVFGNGRTQCVKEMMDSGESIPAGIAVITEGQYKGQWAVPVVFGNDLASREQAEAFSIDHNNLTLTPGIKNQMTVLKMYDPQKYSKMIERIQSVSKEGMVTVDNETARKISAAFNPDIGQRWKDLIQGQETGNNTGNGDEKFLRYKLSFGEYHENFEEEMYQLFIAAVMRYGSIRDALLFGIKE
jgi:hypothetical protein